MQFTICVNPLTPTQFILCINSNGLVSTESLPLSHGESLVHVYGAEFFSSRSNAKTINYQRLRPATSVLRGFLPLYHIRKCPWTWSATEAITNIPLYSSTSELVFYAKQQSNGTLEKSRFKGWITAPLNSSHLNLNDCSSDHLYQFNEQSPMHKRVKLLNLHKFSFKHLSTWTVPP